MSAADRPKQDFVVKAIDEEKMTRVPHMEKVTNSLTELNTEGAIVHRGELLSFFERKKEKYKQRKASAEKQTISTENKKLAIVKIGTPEEVNKGDIEKNSIPEEMSATEMNADVPIVCTSLSEEEVQDKPPKEIHLKAEKPVAETTMARPDSKDQSAVHTPIQQSSRDDEVDLSNIEMSIAKIKSYEENIYSDEEEKALSSEKIFSKIKDVDIAKIISPEEQPDTTEKVDATGDVVDIFKNSSSLYPPNVEKVQENPSKDVHVKVEDPEVNAMEVKLDSKGASSENPLIHKDQEIAHSHIHHDQSSREDTLTKIKITNQLIDMFPHFSPEILVDMLREFGSLEDTVEELLKLSAAEEFLRNDVDEVFLVKEPVDSAEDLLQKHEDEVSFVKEPVTNAEDLQNHKNEANDEVAFVKERVAKSLLLLDEEGMFKKVTLTEKRDFNPDDPLENKFRLAKGQYLSVSREFARSIESIDYVENRILMETFERKKCQLKWEGKDTKEYFLFHGTKNINIESILRENFRMDLAGKNGQVHGKGIYFSEKTAIPNTFTDGSNRKLLLCRVLLGREFVGEFGDIPQGFDSKSVGPDKDKRANINIIKEVDQILPCFVLNLAGSVKYDSLPTAMPAPSIFSRLGNTQRPFMAAPTPNAFRGSSFKLPQSLMNRVNSKNAIATATDQESVHRALFEDQKKVDKKPHFTITIPKSKDAGGTVDNSALNFVSSVAMNGVSPLHGYKSSVAMNGGSPLRGYKVVITNLQTSVTQENILELFGDIGALRRAKLVTPGHAEVIFVMRKEAKRAVEVYHNRQLDGKPMKCTLVDQDADGTVDNSALNGLYPPEGYKVVITNLQTSVTQEDILKLFRNIGILRRVKLITPGHAEVFFVMKNEAVRAVEIYDNLHLNGKPMKCTLEGQDNSNPCTLLAQDTATPCALAGQNTATPIMLLGQNTATPFTLVGQNTSTPCTVVGKDTATTLVDNDFKLVGQVASTPSEGSAFKLSRSVFKGSEFKLPQSLMRRAPAKNARASLATAPDTESVHRALFTDKKNVGNKPVFAITIPKKDKDEPRE